jgi:hypothetical protein
MRLTLCFTSLTLLLIIAFNSSFTSSQDNSFNTLEESSFWNYISKLTLNMEIYEGPMEQSIKDEITTKGKATIVQISPTSIIIEEGFTTFRIYHNSVTGTEESDPIYQTVIYTIDRQTLTYTSIKEKHDDGTETPILEDIIGLPSRQFISTSLQEGQKTSYTAFYWKGDIYTVTYDSFDYKDKKIPVISLNYNGPGHYDPDFNMNVTVNAIFQFEKSTGLKVSQNMTYEAADQRGKKQAISTYEITSTSLFTPDQSQKTNHSPQSSLSNNFEQLSEWIIPLIFAAIIIIVLIAILFLYKRRKTETSTTDAEELEYCYQCGASMPVGSIYCKKCGKKQ